VHPSAIEGAWKITITPYFRHHTFFSQYLLSLAFFFMEIQAVQHPIFSLFDFGKPPPRPHARALIVSIQNTQLHSTCQRRILVADFCNGFAPPSDAYTNRGAALVLEHREEHPFFSVFLSLESVFVHPSQIRSDPRPSYILYSSFLRWPVPPLSVRLRVRHWFRPSRAPWFHLGPA